MVPNGLFSQIPKSPKNMFQCFQLQGGVTIDWNSIEAPNVGLFAIYVRISRQYLKILILYCFYK